VDRRASSPLDVLDRAFVERDAGRVSIRAPVAVLELRERVEDEDPGRCHSSGDRISWAAAPVLRDEEDVAAAGMLDRTRGWRRSIAAGERAAPTAEAA
jgi:hypothetical protein